MIKMLPAFAVAAGLVFGAVAAPAGAQTSALGTMEMGLSMLELSVQRELNRIGLNNVDVTELSLNQISQLQLLLSQPSMEQTQKKQQAENIVAGRDSTIR